MTNKKAKNNTLVHIIPDAEYNAAMQKLANGIVDKMAIEKQCAVLNISVAQSDLIPALKAIATASYTVSKGSIKKAVAYAVFSILGYREEKGKLITVTPIDAEHVKPIFAAIERAPFSAQIKRGARYFAEGAGVSYHWETVDKVKTLKLVTGTAPDKATIAQLCKDLQNRSLSLADYMPTWAREQKAKDAAERIEAGAYAEVEGSIEGTYKKAKDAADRLRAVDTKGMSEAKKAEHEKRLAFYCGKQQILSDVLAMLRKNKGNRYFKYLGEKA